MEIKAPYEYSSAPRPWVFLSGSIEMGKAVDWQTRVATALPKYTVLNPRRDDWDSTWKQSIHDARFREQVEWELEALASASLTLVYFAPDTAAPITLLEFGLQAGRSRPLIACCPSDFYRRGNVEMVCRRYGILLVDSIDELVSQADTRLQRRRKYGVRMDERLQQ